MYAPQRFSPHLQYVATLLCEIREFKRMLLILTASATN